MTKRNDSGILEKFQQPFPMSFKVIGVGNGVTDIIEKVKSFGYDCVGCLVAKSTDDCIPMDDDKMAIIVARDNEGLANAIAKTYHDAGVLTIGLVNGADISCYDTIAIDTDSGTFPEVIKILLAPLATMGYICYDFNDLCTTLHNRRFFKTLVADGKSIEDGVINMQRKMENVTVDKIEFISALLYFNREKLSAITMDDMAPFNNMMSGLPESIDVIWGVNFDNTLSDDIIRLSFIMSGREL